MKVSTRTSATASLMACQPIAMEKASTQPRKPMLWKRWFFALLLFVAAGANAQIVNVTNASVGNGTYPTLAAAFTAISVAGNNGSPAINVSITGNTTETATATLGSFTWASVTVTATVPVVVSGSIAGAIIRLNGADNVTIDGRIAGAGRNITVQNNSTAASAAIWISSLGAGAGATGNTIRNLEILCGANPVTTTTVTMGIIMCGTTISVTANGDDNDNNTFRDNRIIKCRYGIVTRGVTTNNNQNVQVLNNIVGPTAFGTDEIGKIGILMQADNASTVSGNTVQFVGGAFANNSAGADRMGIAIGNESWSATPATLTSANYTVTRNLVHDIVEERTFSAVGINLATTNGGAATNNVVCGNMIYNVKANGTGGDMAIGLGIAGGHTDQVVYNSIHMTGDVDPNPSASASTNYGSGIRIANASSASHANLTLKNNIVYMDLSSSSGPTVRYYAISGNATGYSFGTGGENYNDYYINPSNPQSLTGGLGTNAAVALTTPFATLANWVGAYTAPQDANSIQADPGFLSLSDLHINPTQTAVSNIGTVVGITCTIDFDDQTRSLATPDIGADEYTAIALPPNDAGVTAVTALPASPQLCAGTAVTLTATVRNFGANTQNAINVVYTVNGGSPVGPVSTVGPIITNGTEPVVFTGANAFTPLTGGTYIIKVYTQLAGDATAANDTTTITYIVGNKIAVFPYIEPFTTAPGWTVTTEVVVGTTPIWGLATATTGPDGVASNVSANGNFFNASAGRIERLSSPVLDFTALTNPVAHYYLSHRTFTGGEDDGLEMVISIDCGQTFATLVPTKFNTSVPSLSTMIPIGTTHVPSAVGNWRHESIDLSAFAGQASVIIGFRAISDFGNSIWIDNFIVSNASAICNDAVAATGVYSCAGTATVNITTLGDAAGGDLKVTTYSTTAPNATFVTNVTATTQDGSIFTPDQVKTGNWFKATYTGNTFNGYATYNISIDVTGYTPASNVNKLYILKRADQLSSWVALNTTAVGNILTASGLTTFSDFAIGGVACITPAAPVVTSPICSGATSVSGTSTEANGTTIEVFVNNISAGTTTVSANAWTKTVAALSAGNTVKAKAIASPGCESVFSSSVTVSQGLTATFTKTNLSSCGPINDGTITVTATGGSGVYTYSWTGSTGSGNPAPMNFTAGNVNPLTNLTYGFYNVTVTDANGCGSFVISNIHVQFAYAVVVTNSGSASSSCGNTGSVTLYGNAGVLPYSYALVSGSGQPTPAPGAFVPTNNFTALAAGAYTAFVKDAAGCVTPKNVTVTAVAALVVNPNVVGASSCAPDGSIQLFRTGGIPPYSYALVPGAGQPTPAPGAFGVSNNFPGLAAGPYSTFVKDAAGCVSTAPATVTAGAGLTATAGKTNTSTCVNDGTIQLNGSGGVPGYMYKLDVAPYLSYQPSNSFTALAQGNYVGTVKDSKGCTGTVNVTINLNSIVVTASASPAPNCASNGALQLFRTGGVGPYTYSIDGNVYQSGTTFPSVTFPVLLPGTYDGYVKDSKGCIGILNGIVVGPSCPRPNAVFTKSNAAAVNVSINEVLKATAYPNPSSTEFMLALKSNSSEKVAVIVTDILGRKVFQAEGSASKSYRFGSNFKAGTYLVQVLQGKNTQSIKLVKE